MKIFPTWMDQRMRIASCLIVLCWIMVILVLALIVVLTHPAHGESVCLSKKEARQLWPHRHLYWYGDHCWSNRRGKPPSGLKFDPIIEKKSKTVDGNIANFRGKIEIARAEASSTAPPDENPVVKDAVEAGRVDDPPTRRDTSPTNSDQPFVGEPMRMIMVPDYAVKKSDRIPDSGALVRSPPQPATRLPAAQPEPVAGSIKPRLNAWFFLLMGLSGFSLLSAVVIVSMQQRRKRYVPTTSPVERPDYAAARPRTREPSRGDGPRNQQPYFSTGNVFGRQRGIEQRRHDADPAPIADRRDNPSAIGAWADRFGLRAEESPDDPAESVADQPVGDRWYRKRFKVFARG